MMLSCTLWSCSKSDGPIDDPDDPDNPDAPTNVTLDISVSDLVFEAEGGEKETFKKLILEIELLKNSILRDKEITPVIKNMKTEVI